MFDLIGNAAMIMLSGSGSSGGGGASMFEKISTEYKLLQTIDLIEDYTCEVRWGKWYISPYSHKFLTMTGVYNQNDKTTHLYPYFTHYIYAPYYVVCKSGTPLWATFHYTGYAYTYRVVVESSDSNYEPWLSQKQEVESVTASFEFVNGVTTRYYPYLTGAVDYTTHYTNYSVDGSISSEGTNDGTISETDGAIAFCGSSANFNTTYGIYTDLSDLEYNKALWEFWTACYKSASSTSCAYDDFSTLLLEE